MLYKFERVLEGEKFHGMLYMYVMLLYSQQSERSHILKVRLEDDGDVVDLEISATGRRRRAEPVLELLHMYIYAN